MPGSATTAWLVGNQTFTPQVFDYRADGTAGPGSITVPTGATQMVVQVFGAGGGGGGGNTTLSTGGGGGGGGAYVIITKTLTSGDAGKAITYALVTGGAVGGWLLKSGSAMDVFAASTALMLVWLMVAWGAHYVHPSPIGAVTAHSR